MNKTTKTILIVLLVIATVSFSIYAFFISSPKQIFNYFFNNDDNPQIVNNDNVNGIYLYSEPLDDYYAIYSGCRINTIDFYIVVYGSKYRVYESTCIATYFIEMGKKEDLKITYNDEVQTFELTYRDKKYVKTMYKSLVPEETIFKGNNIKSIYLESLKVIIQRTQFENHYKDINIPQISGLKPLLIFNLVSGPTGYYISFAPLYGDPFYSISFNDLEHIPSFHSYNYSLGIVENESTSDRVYYTLKLLTDEGIVYDMRDEFPITVDDVELNPDYYNVYITKAPTEIYYKIYLSEYKDFCIPDDDSNKIAYYEFKLVYNYGSKKFDRPEFVKKGYAKEGCGKVIPLKEG